MPSVRTIWKEKVSSLHVRKVDEVVRGAQGLRVVLLYTMSESLIGVFRVERKKGMQRQFKGFALGWRYVICRVWKLP